jgi:hypothetical protein
MIKHYQCLEFSQKASRYILAMKETPIARLMELMPILYLLPSKKDVFLDLFAGTGFVSQFLASQFSRIIQIDEVEALLNSYIYPSISIKGDALNPDVLSVVHNKVNMAICFAGFHHILKKNNGELDEQVTERLRISALAEWRKMLDKDGRLRLEQKQLCRFIPHSQMMFQVIMSHLQIRYLGLSEEEIHLLEPMIRMT